MIQSTLTTKGQTTIPREVRQTLGLQPGMRLIYEIGDNYVVLRSQPALMDVFGALKSKKAGADFRKVRETATHTWMRKTSLR